MITPELVDRLYNDRQFNELVKHYQKALAKDDVMGPSYLEMLLRRCWMLAQDAPERAQEAPPPPRRAQTVLEPEELDLALPKASGNGNGHKPPVVSADEKAQFDREIEAGKPDPAKGLQEAFAICKKSFDEHPFDSNGVKVVRVRQERNINGVEELLRKAGYKFSTLMVGIEMQGDIGKGGGQTPERNGMWRLTFEK